MKNKNLKSLYFIAGTVVAVVMMLGGCKKPNYHEILPAEESEWMIFDRNEYFFLKNTQGEIDTFKVIRKSKAYYHPDYEEFLEAEIVRLDDTLKRGVQNGGLYMLKSDDGLSVEAWLPHFGEKIDLTKRVAAPAMVDGKNYADVFILPVNQLYLDFDNYIDTLYYSKSFGFIKYVDIYGEEWVKYK